MNITFFASASKFRAWLEEHHETTQELWGGFSKKSSGQPSMTWPEAVDAALCFGWIDGKRQGIDDLSYTLRFTPRNPRSKRQFITFERRCCPFFTFALVFEPRQGPIWLHLRWPEGVKAIIEDMIHPHERSHR